MVSFLAKNVLLSMILYEKGGIRMKQLFSVSLVLMLAFAVAVPMAFAAMEEGRRASVADGQEAAENLNRGAQHVDWAWTEVMQHGAEEAGKGTTADQHLIGAAAGSIIGARAGLHRIGAGAIDLLTFWIPKTEPLIDPADPTLR